MPVCSSPAFPSFRAHGAYGCQGWGSPESGPFPCPGRKSGGRECPGGRLIAGVGRSGPARGRLAVPDCQASAAVRQERCERQVLECGRREAARTQTLFRARPAPQGTQRGPRLRRCSPPALSLWGAPVRYGREIASGSSLGTSAGAGEMVQGFQHWLCTELASVRPWHCTVTQASLAAALRGLERHPGSPGTTGAQFPQAFAWNCQLGSVRRSKGFACRRPTFEPPVLLGPPVLSLE